MNVTSVEFCVPLKLGLTERYSYALSGGNKFATTRYCAVLAQLSIEFFEIIYLTRCVIDKPKPAQYGFLGK